MEKIDVKQTNRGFNHVDLKDKYGNDFYIRQSSGDMSDVWLGIDIKEIPDHTGEIVRIATILIDDKVWKAIKKARGLARK